MIACCYAIVIELFAIYLLTKCFRLFLPVVRAGASLLFLLLVGVFQQLPQPVHLRQYEPSIQARLR